MDVMQAPAPVQATLKAEGARVEIQQETEGGKTLYEATVSKDGKSYSLHVANDGKVLKRESLKAEKQAPAAPARAAGHSSRSGPTSKREG